MTIFDRILNLALQSDDEIEKYFNGRGFRVIKKGKRGKHEPDYLVIDSRGIEYPVEEKALRETKGSTSSWSSYWRYKLIDYTNDPKDQLSPQERGWLATIDGQLRDWCALSKTKIGYLAVEAATTRLGKRDSLTIREHIDNALTYLSSEGKTKSWNAEEYGAYTFFEILY